MAFKHGKKYEGENFRNLTLTYVFLNHDHIFDPYLMWFDI